MSFAAIQQSFRLRKVVRYSTFAIPSAELLVVGPHHSSSSAQAIPGCCRPLGDGTPRPFSTWINHTNAYRTVGRVVRTDP